VSGADPVSLAGARTIAHKVEVDPALLCLVVTLEESKGRLYVSRLIYDLLWLVECLEPKVLDITISAPTQDLLKVTLCVGGRGHGISLHPSTGGPSDLSQPDLFALGLSSDLFVVTVEGGKTVVDVYPLPIREDVGHDDVADSNDGGGDNNVGVRNGDGTSSVSYDLFDLDDFCDEGGDVDGLAVEVLRADDDPEDVGPTEDLCVFDELRDFPAPPVFGRGLHAEHDLQTSLVSCAKSVI